MLDTVLHVYRTGNKTTVNLALAVFPNETVFPSIAFDGRTIAFTVSEFGQGNIDLNGDGDTVDRVLHFYHVDDDKIINLKLAGRDPAVSGRLAAFSVNEAYQFGKDLNGDGDMRDCIMHVVDVETLTIHNTGMAGYSPAICGNRIVFHASEYEQG